MYVRIQFKNQSHTHFVELDETYIISITIKPDIFPLMNISLSINRLAVNSVVSRRKQVTSLVNRQRHRCTNHSSSRHDACLGLSRWQRGHSRNEKTKM